MPDPLWGLQWDDTKDPNLFLSQFPIARATTELVGDPVRPEEGHRTENQNLSR